MSERDAFEAWAEPITALAKENGKYVEVMTSLAWEAWQARALAAPTAPTEPDCSGGMPCTTCPDKRKCQRGCIRQIEALENPNRKDLRAECDAVDALLRGLGLEPGRCRTEGGALNVGRTLSLLKAAPTPTESQPAEADERSEREIAWTDKDGVHHSMPQCAVESLLERFWDEWPGGWSEIEAEKRSRALSAPTAPAQAEPDAYRSALEHAAHVLKSDAGQMTRWTTADGILVLLAPPPTAASDATPPATAAGPSDAATEEVIDYARAMVNFYRERGEFVPVMIENLGEALDDFDAAIRATKGGKL